MLNREVSGKCGGGEEKQEEREEGEKGGHFEGFGGVVVRREWIDGVYIGV
jgi:hypothetical protein